MSCTLFVDGASWRAMASTRVMVPKDCNRSGRWRAAHLPAHQRGRWMDGALQVWGSDPGRGRGRSAAPSCRRHAPACRPCRRRKKVGVVSHRQALSLPRGRTMETERFVRVLSTPLVEPPLRTPPSQDTPRVLEHPRVSEHGRCPKTGRSRTPPRCFETRGASERQKCSRTGGHIP